MRSGFVSLHEGTPVERAIEALRRLRPPSDRAYYLYTVDGEGRLVGVVSVRDLIVAAPGTPLAEIAERDVHAVDVGLDREEVARTLQRYNLLAIPVVDGEGRLVGATTADDVIDVLAEEATEDMYRMVGLDEAERVFSPVRTSVRRRLPWMLVNLLWAFAAAAIVSLFDETLARFTLLAALMPVVAGQGGNAGAQTATIAVRSIAIGDLDVRDVFRATRKEIVVGLANGGRDRDRGGGGALRLGAERRALGGAGGGAGGEHRAGDAAGRDHPAGPEVARHRPGAGGQHLRDGRDGHPELRAVPGAGGAGHRADCVRGYCFGFFHWCMNRSWLA